MTRFAPLGSKLTPGTLNKVKLHSVIMDVIIDCEGREIMYLVAFVRVRVCPSSPVWTRSNWSHYKSWGVRLCVCNQWAYAGNCADAVDRLLISWIYCKSLSSFIFLESQHRKDTGHLTQNYGKITKKSKETENISDNIVNDSRDCQKTFLLGIFVKVQILGIGFAENSDPHGSLIKWSLAFTI